MKPITDLARHLDAARLAAQETKRLTEAHPELTAAEGYAVQEAGIEIRLGRGERIIAYKMGLTSKAKRDQMGLHQAIYGVLTDKMRLTPGAPYSLKWQIHPKAEPEIALKIGRPLQGNLTRDEVWAAVTDVAPAIEVLDSRYVGFKYFSLPDVIADNASSSQFLIGESVPKPDHWSSLESWMLRFFANGTLAHEAPGSEISGSPIQSLVDQVALLTEHGKSLEAGSWILLGAATAAVPLERGMEVRLELSTPATCETGRSLVLRVEA